MSNIKEIQGKIIQAVYEYDIQSLHSNMIKFVDYCENELSNSTSTDTVLISDIFEAYKDHDYLRLADLFEYGFSFIQ